MINLHSVTCASEHQSGKPRLVSVPVLTPTHRSTWQPGRDLGCPVCKMRPLAALWWGHWEDEWGNTHTSTWPHHQPLGRCTKNLWWFPKRVRASATEFQNSGTQVSQKRSGSRFLNKEFLKRLRPQKWPSHHHTHSPAQGNTITIIQLKLCIQFQLILILNSLCSRCIIPFSSCHKSKISLVRYY